MLTCRFKSTEFWDHAIMSSVIMLSRSMLVKYFFKRKSLPVHIRHVTWVIGHVDLNRQSDANTSSWVQQLSCFGQHVCRMYFGRVFSWKLTTHLRLSGLCLLPVACVILSSLAARCLQYPLTACYLMVFMVFHDAERSLLLTVAWFSLKGMTAAWFSCVFADCCIVFI